MFSKVAFLSEPAIRFSRCPELGRPFPLVARRRCFLPSSFRTNHSHESCYFQASLAAWLPLICRSGWTPAPRDAASSQPWRLEISMDRETMQPRILIADDQQAVLHALRLPLTRHRYSIGTV